MTAGFLSFAVKAGSAFAKPEDDEERKLFERLQDCEVIRETRPFKDAICPICGRQKPLHRGAFGSGLIRCDEGDIPVDFETLRRWYLDRSRLVYWLREMLSLDERKQELISGTLWLLGRHPGTHGGYPLWLFLSEGQSEKLIAAYQMLSRRAPQEQGVLIVDHAMALGSNWPNKSTPVLIDDLTTLDRGILSANKAVLHSAAPEGRKPPKPKGRHSLNASDPLKVFLDRVKSGEAIQVSCKEESEAIAAWEVTQFGQKDARKWTSIRNDIGSTYAAWKKAGFPPDLNAITKIEET